DYSTPLTDDRRWAGRVVAAHEAGDSYLRGKHDRRDFLYGVIDGQIGEGTLTAGLSYQKGRTDGVMWGALIFMNSDGSQNEWPRDASTTLDWTYWNTTTRTGVLEYAHWLGDNWKLKLGYNRQEIRNDERMFYAFDANGTGLDPATGGGLTGYAWGGYDKL